MIPIPLDPGALTPGRLVFPLLLGVGTLFLLRALFPTPPDLAERLRRADPETWVARRREAERDPAPVAHWRAMDALLRPVVDDLARLAQGALGPLGAVGGRALERELAANLPGMTPARWWADTFVVVLVFGGFWPAGDLVTEATGGTVRLAPLGGWPPAWWLLWAGIGLGWAVLRLREAGRRRRTALRAQIVPALDMLALAAGAGLALEPALVEVGAELGGALGMELLQVGRAVALGQHDLEGALDALARRLDVPELGRLAEALRAAHRLGLPLVQTLGEQADRLRDEARLRLVAQGGRLATLLPLPVAITAFPVLALLVLYPVARLLGGLGG